MKIAGIVGAVLLAAGCGGSSLGAGPCEGDTPALECSVECTGDAECALGFYCGDDGLCTAECTAGGNQCATGSHCDDRGRCVADGLDGGNECPNVAVNLQPQTPTVVLLIDQSGSMNDAFGNTDRWNAVKTALVDPVQGAVAQLDDRVVFGAALYTSLGGNAGGTCPMLQETPPVISNFTNIKALLDANSPASDTPTAESITAVAGGFPAADPERPGPRAIILATDGNPDNCVDPNAHDAGSRAASEAAVAAAYQDGLYTYVLSVGDQVLQSHLDNLADIGIGAAPGSGMGTAYVANDPAELVDAFNDIIRGVRSCQLTLSGTVDPNQASTGIVTLNGMTLTYGTDWTLLDSMTIELLGAACTTLLEVDVVTLSAEFPCGAVVL